MLKRLSTQRIGRTAEKLAKRYLQDQGLSFISSNFNCRHGEIDIIAKDLQTLVFIEVRYRHQKLFGHAFETIDRRKQQKVIKAAEYYLYQHQLTESVSSRFDVIGIEPKDDHRNRYIKNVDDYDVHWIKNAFC